MILDPLPNGASERIMIVDDDASLAKGLKSALEKQGYLVLAVCSGIQALDSFRQFKPDLVLLDVMMPGVGGWEVLTHLRAEPGGEKLPVIMLTGAAAEGAKVKGFSLGADDYVTKPFSLQELRCRIAAVLRRSHPVDIADDCCIPVVVGGSGHEILRCRDVFYIEGIRNYTHVHTADARYLSRLTLGSLEQRRVEGFVRVHRSFIVNMEHVKACGWATKSSYRLRLNNPARTEVPVSRAAIAEVQRCLGLRPGPMTEAIQ